MTKLEDSRFKSAEKFSTLKAEPPFILRVDGWHFHTFTKERNFIRPFDQALSGLMSSAMVGLFAPFKPHFAMTHSDEASFLFVDTVFDRVEKMDSLVAATFAADFSLRAGAIAPFDARVIPLASRDEAVDYFVWRQQDCKRNFAHAWADSVLQARGGLSPAVAARRLKGMNEERQRLLCSGYGMKLDLAPRWQQFGLSARWEEYMKKGYNPITKTEVTVERRKVVLAACDDFYTPMGLSALRNAVLG
jgi:tRNA(His) 5'-end guanylyltransferase